MGSQFNPCGAGIWIGRWRIDLKHSGLKDRARPSEIMGMATPEAEFWVRGKLVLLWRDFARGQFPPEEWEAFLDGLPEASPWRQLPDPQGWLPYAQLWDALECLARSRPWDTYGARSIAGAQMMFREGFLETPVSRTPEGFLERLPDIWDEMYRGGTLRLETLLPGQASLRVAFPHPEPALYLLMLSGWIRECLTLFGAREAEVSLTPEPQGGCLRVSWVPQASSK
jgi:hypothetical protein